MLNQDLLKHYECNIKTIIQMWAADVRTSCARQELEKTREGITRRNSNTVTGGGACEM